MKKQKLKKKKKSKLLLNLIIILFIVLLGIFFYTEYKKNTLFKILEKETINVSKYTIYGTHLNIEGNFDLKNIDNCNLVLKSIKSEIDINTIYNGKSFKTSNKINGGINLDEINIGDYFILLKVKFKDSTIKYYSLTNNTNYKNINYYTITKNHSNNKIDIGFKRRKNISYMYMNVKRKKIPNDVYDIVIDAGHGGNDTGALGSNYTESELTLKYAVALKKSLEKKGYKIKLTRDHDKILDSYGDNGRAVIPQNVKAKYTFSIHLNSNEYEIKNGGVEIYAPNNADLSLATSLANNIVKRANTNYSTNLAFKVKDGVYVRTFTQGEIDSYKNSYPLTTEIPYYYMIRETGGIITKAYVNDKNNKYKFNPYYNSNIGVETYILELGYIISPRDLNNLLNNQNKYIEAITESIDEHIKTVK